MDKRIASPRIRTDHAARSLIQNLEALERELGIAEAVVYYDFPIFRDESDKLYKPQVVLASRSHGIVLFAISNDILAADTDLSQLDSILFAKLLKSPFLRLSKREIALPITSVIYTTQQPHYDPAAVENQVISTVPALRAVLQKASGKKLSIEQWKELISLIEGGKGIIRPKERDIANLPPNSKAAILAKLESEIANFDKDQRLAAITLVEGPQRIRGLAGSGKTIVLAMKAAHIHLHHPEATILFTFWTKSLYDLAKQLITRFYRQFDDRDPDWTKLNILHAWGGKNIEGVYYNACIDNGIIPLRFKQVPPTEKTPLDTSVD